MNVFFILLFAFFVFATIGIRWVRWQFLLRRWDVRVKTRESFLLFTGTLILNFTPLAIGEVVRNIVLVRKNLATVSRSVGLWILDRGLDIIAGLVVLNLNLQTSVQFGMALVSGLIAFYISSLITIRDNENAMDHVLSVAVVFLSSLTCWFTISFASSVFLDLSFDAVLVPTYHSLATMLTVPAVVALGFSFLMWIVFFSKMKTAVFSKQHGTQDHFNELSSEYNDLIPEHVQKLLLEKKTKATLSVLSKAGIDGKSPLRALDFGCGHGQYAIHFATMGYKMSACDRSSGQVSMAQKKAKDAGVNIDFHALESATLPFPSNEFDMVYAINVLHHITDAKVLDNVLAEIRRVLKPGGVFVLHDVNVRNPLFRFYMTYVFPLLKSIDDGTEVWLAGHKLKAQIGGNWGSEVEYFTFFPDFIPDFLLKLLRPVEAKMEQTFFKYWSAHFCAGMKKNA